MGKCLTCGKGFASGETFGNPDNIDGYCQSCATVEQIDKSANWQRERIRNEPASKREHVLKLLRIRDIRGTKQK